MKRLFGLLLLLSLLANFSSAKADLPGKTIFYNSKGKFGSCNTCHTNGSSAGRYDPTTGQISEDEGKKIPCLKGIGKRKEPDIIIKDIELMKKMFGFKLTNEQVKQLAEYIATF